MERAAEGWGEGFMCNILLLHLYLCICFSYLPSRERVNPVGPRQAAPLPASGEESSQPPLKPARPPACTVSHN